MGICRACGLESAILEGGRCLCCCAEAESGGARCSVCGTPLATAVRVAGPDGEQEPVGICDTCAYIEECESAHDRHEGRPELFSEAPTSHEVTAAKLDGYCPRCGRKGDFAEAARCPCGFSY